MVNPEVRDAELTAEELVDAVGELPADDEDRVEEDKMTSVS
jgi:hypothetical protein